MPEPLDWQEVADELAEALMWASGAFDTDEKSEGWAKVARPALERYLALRNPNPVCADDEGSTPACPDCRGYGGACVRCKGTGDAADVETADEGGGRTQEARQGETQASGDETLGSTPSATRPSVESP